MSDQNKNETKTNVKRKQVRTRVKQLRESRKYSVLGVPELVGLAGSGVLFLAAIFSYFYFLTPARARLKSVENERAVLRDRISIAQSGVDLDASPQATVDEINQSLEKFENEALLQRSQGRMDLYAQLNEMMRRHKLRNTAGPVYANLDALGTPGAPATASRTGNARWQSLYPGIGISVTVEGPYASLRRFLREVETSKHFIVINAVELEGVTDANSQVGASLVSLHIDMATYFRRENITPAVETR